MIRDLLCLDHFYVGFDSRTIAKFKGLSKLLTRCDYSEVRSGNDTWRGVYLSAADGSYFEMIDGGVDGRKYSAGIAASPWKVQYLDLRKIRQEQTDFHWETYVRYWRKTRKKWFTGVRLKDPVSGRNGVRPLSTWLMHYHQVHEPTIVLKQTPYTVERFQSLRVMVGADYRDRIQQMSAILPGKRHFGKNQALLTIPLKGARELNVEIKFVKGNALVQLVDLVAEAGPAAKRIRAKLGDYGLEMDSKRVRLFKE
jgi:hypothetical protein